MEKTTPFTDLSIVVPAYNEEKSVGELYRWIERVVTAEKLSWELLFIDDGSSDRTWEKITELTGEDSRVKGIRFLTNYGKSDALHAAFSHTLGKVVITMDADLQDSPDEIPELYRMIVEENYDMVSGWKKRRFDPLGKTIPSKLFNKIAKIFSGIKLHDFNCGLKAYRSEVVKQVELYGEMHRYIPVLAHEIGYTRIGEKVVQHQARKYGKSKFGMERFLRGFFDLLTIMFLSKFGRRPMHFFGAWGGLMFLLGFGLAFFLGGQKLYSLHIGETLDKVTESPYFYIALTMMMLGTQLFLAGFLGELITRNSSERNRYKEAEKTFS